MGKLLFTLSGPAVKHEMIQKGTII